MGLADVQPFALCNDGLMTLDDFADFKAEEFKTALKNARPGISGTPRIDTFPAVTEITWKLHLRYS